MRNSTQNNIENFDFLGVTLTFKHAEILKIQSEVLVVALADRGYLGQNLRLKKRGVTEEKLSYEELVINKAYNMKNVKWIFKVMGPIYNHNNPKALRNFKELMAKILEGSILKKAQSIAFPIELALGFHKELSVDVMFEILLNFIKKNNHKFFLKNIFLASLSQETVELCKSRFNSLVPKFKLELKNAHLDSEPPKIFEEARKEVSCLETQLKNILLGNSTQNKEEPQNQCEVGKKGKELLEFELRETLQVANKQKQEEKFKMEVQQNNNQNRTELEIQLRKTLIPLNSSKTEFESQNLQENKTDRTEKKKLLEIQLREALLVKSSSKSEKNLNLLQIQQNDENRRNENKELVEIKLREALFGKNRSKSEEKVQKLQIQQNLTNDRKELLENKLREALFDKNQFKHEEEKNSLKIRQKNEKELLETELRKAISLTTRNQRNMNEMGEIQRKVESDNRETNKILERELWNAIATERKPLKHEDELNFLHKQSKNEDKIKIAPTQQKNEKKGLELLANVLYDALISNGENGKTKKRETQENFKIKNNFQTPKYQPLQKNRQDGRYGFNNSNGCWRNKKKTGEEKTCKICMETDCNSVFVPCGHIGCCYDCAVNLKECPFCRQGISQVMRTYVI